VWQAKKLCVLKLSQIALQISEKDERNPKKISRARREYRWGRVRFSASATLAAADQNSPAIRAQPADQKS
tara:strand:- start:401 stop:610 length:210 start_codon:yes stop_codon:yes gene_type:complete